MTPTFVVKASRDLMSRPHETCDSTSILVFGIPHAPPSSEGAHDVNNAGQAYTARLLDKSIGMQPPARSNNTCNKRNDGQIDIELCVDVALIEQPLCSW
ncbi:hypothetical protein [Paraburkholderia phenoliruptrix]|uniref:hypothetical protein n=1 Tax=Paraburkholderia phenoliruptrix TaxID=252970 RepID=UPI0005A0B183|nr:hypothetical protein [Paraburkholderia phenoliruptrix]